MIQMYRTIIAKINVLNQASRIFRGDQNEQLSRSSIDLSSPMLIQQRDELSSPLLTNPMKLAYLGGTIRKNELMSFKRMIFRATRGKAFTQFFDMDIKPEDRLMHIDDSHSMLVYLIMFEEGTYLRNRIHKICANTQESV